MNSTNSPYLPETAPFTEEQRSYLNGFLAGLFSSGGPSLAESAKEEQRGAAKEPVTILWGSQTGNTETLAKKAAKRLEKAGYLPSIADMGDYEKGRLTEEKTLLIMTSTYGDGDPPDNAMDLHAWLRSSDAPRLEGLRYSVLALGDTNYPDFCKCGIEFDQRLAELGAERMADRVDCDVDFDEPFERWLLSIEAQKGVEKEALRPAESSGETSLSVSYGKKNPFAGKILKNGNLNGPGSAKETRHIEISLEGSGLAYEPGDALAILPQNDAESVEGIIALLGFDPVSEVTLASGENVSLREALTSQYDLSKLSMKVAKSLCEKSGDEALGKLVGDKAAFLRYSEGRQLVDMLRDFNVSFASPDEFVSILSKLAPRLYSISSSPKAHPDEVHITVGVVRYEAHGALRKGVCSNFLAGQSTEESVKLFFHHTKTFKLPENGDVPIIMVGPGTGIAPFRAFIEERKATAAKGENWLFFGDQKAETDFLYQDELEDYFRQGHLHRMDTAFSRDQAEKVYVQNRMLENGAELYSWLERGAHFYVCGDASRMAKDVDSALHQIVEDHGKMTPADAQLYVKSLKSEKRYLRDVY